jgi:hypothetical protein
MKWLISCPVWGDRYRRNFLACGLPALLQGLQYAQIRDYRFLIFTDKPEDFAIVPNCECRPVPEGYNGPSQLGNAHRIGWQSANIGEAIMFCNADMTFSVEAFHACEQRFMEGKKHVACHAVRTKDIRAPVGWPAPQLLSWGWTNRHRWVDDCIYQRGHVAGPAVVVFDHAGTGSVVAHCFSLQPAAIFKDRDRPFVEPTADEIPSCFTKDEMHVVTSLHEMAIVEATDDDLWYGTNPHVLDKSVVIGFAPVYTTPMMCHQFSHQVVIRGNYMQYAQLIANDCLAHIDQQRRPTRLADHDQIMAAK